MKLLKIFLPNVLVILGACLLAFGLFTRPTDPFTIDLVNYHTTEKIAGFVILVIGLLILFQIKNKVGSK